LKLKADIEHIIAHTKPVWKELSGKTILLTGGTGFFGKWILESFIYANSTLQLNAKIFVLSRNPDLFLNKYPHFKNEALHFITGDIKDFQFPKEPIDFIIHAATDVDVVGNVENPIHTFESIIEGAKHILELARIKKVKAILHTSSGAVYGKQPYDVTHIDEDFNGSPDIFDKHAAYGEGKRAAEMLCNFYYNKHEVNSKIARCFSFVGPYLPLNGNFAIGNFINDVIQGNDIIINGDGTPYRSYLYASDLTIWLWNILLFGKPCRPYNVGSDKDLTIEDLAHLVAKNSDKEIKVEIALPKKNGSPLRYVPSIKRTETELGLKVYVDLRTAITKTIEFNKSVLSEIKK
jgi:nucleoside-diphosphate-sugar epimerase